MKNIGLAEKTKSFWTDFRKFIAKGNVVDLAVAVIIGTAFNKIVSSVVNGILMPLLSLLIGKIHFDDLKIVLVPGREAVTDAAGTVIEEPVTEIAVLYGSVIQNVIDFLVVALCIFLVLRVLLKAKDKLKEKETKEKEAEAARKKAEEEAAAEAAKRAAEALATEEKELKANIFRQTDLLEQLVSLQKEEKKQ